MEAKIKKERVCLDCGVDISNRGSAAKRCESCGDKHNFLRGAISNKAWRKANPDRRKAIQARYSENNKEKIRIKNTECYKKRPEKYKANKKRYYEKNREEIMPKRASRRSSDKDRVSPSYAAELLKLPVSQCTPELIEMKREQVLLHRLAKVLKQEIVNQLEK
jgi:hypothetical protein